MTKLELLKQEEIELYSRLKAIKKRQQEIIDMELMRQYNIDYGDIIEFPKEGVIIKGEFFKIEDGYFWIRLYNLNGKPGLRERRVWDYERKIMTISKKVHIDPDF